MRLRCFFLLLTLVNILPLSAQNLKRVHGEYTYHVPENVSLEDGKRIAIERAKIQAIADAFGSLVSQDNTTVVRNDNGKSSIDMWSIGGSEVRGEWIETIGEPKVEPFYERNMLAIRVSIDGNAREINNANVNFEAKILRNGTEERFESDVFKDGDDLYLYFKSPVNGYLAVYFMDENTEQVYCLLPYKGSGEPAYKIVHDKPYIFFSCKKADENPDEVDEYTMTCEHSIERNTIYIVFSPNVFAKALAEDDDAGLPRQLSLKEFRKWLAKVRKKDIFLTLQFKQIETQK